MIFKTGTSSFTVRSGGVICDILMIGGGGVGSYFRGGGGAGACIVAIGHTLPGGVCNVTVGAGGYSSINGNGSDSSISVSETTLYLAKGGGGGVMDKYNNGKPGGCGAGGGYGGYYGGTGGKDVSTNIVNGVRNIGPTTEPTYAVFGNKGGDQLVDFWLSDSAYSCPGGGGIGAAAPNHANGDLAAGPGGAGLNAATINGITYNFKSYFANNNTFGHDNNGYIGGGGSGFARYNLTQADGGIGGGGKGTANPGEYTSINSTPGATNTGSGGGGGDGNGDASGGSGIVIIRYNSMGV